MVLAKMSAGGSCISQGKSLYMVFVCLSLGVLVPLNLTQCAPVCP